MNSMLHLVLGHRNLTVPSSNVLPSRTDRTTHRRNHSMCTRRLELRLPFSLYYAFLPKTFTRGSKGANCFSTPPRGGPVGFPKTSCARRDQLSGTFQDLSAATASPSWAWRCWRLAPRPSFAKAVHARYHLSVLDHLLMSRERPTNELVHARWMLIPVRGVGHDIL